MKLHTFDFAAKINVQIQDAKGEIQKIIQFECN